MNPRVCSVVVESGHTLRLAFANGEQRTLRFSEYLDVPVFQRLRDPAFFALARVAQGTVTWPGGIDFDPDTLYVDSVPVGANERTVA
jgi:hypothetical protein